MDQRELVERINRLEQQVRNLLEGREVGYYTANSPWIKFSAPLTSTSYDGDSFSTTAATLIDLSATFTNAAGETVPDGVKAIIARIEVNDSAAWGTDGLYAALGPGSTTFYQLTARAFGGDVKNNVMAPVLCDENGDVYFRCIASGAGTLDVSISIWGYIK